MTKKELQAAFGKGIKIYDFSQMGTGQQRVVVLAYKNKYGGHEGSAVSDGLAFEGGDICKYKDGVLLLHKQDVEMFNSLYSAV